MRMLFFIGSIILYLSSTAQDTTFRYAYGGLSYDQGRSVQQTSDGGYIMAGSTGSFGQGNSDMYLVKVDSAGTYQWSKTYGGLFTDFANSVRQTTDQGYIIAGYTNSFGAGGYDVYLVKTDSIGDTLWTRTFGGNDWDIGYSVVQTADNGFAIAGETFSFGAGGSDVYLIRTDSAGNLDWTKTYGGTGEDFGRSVHITLDGGFILAGGTANYGSGKLDVYAIKTNASGDTVWSGAFGGSLDDFANEGIATSDSGFAFIGTTESFGAGGKDSYILKIGKKGIFTWDNWIGGVEDDEGRGIRQTANDDFAIIGYAESFGPTNAHLVLLNSGGWQQWGYTFGDSGEEEGYSMGMTKDGGFVCLGSTNSFGNGLTDLYLIKTDSLGITSTVFVYEYLDTIPIAVNTVDVLEMESQKTILFSPNPFSQMTNINISDSYIGFETMDLYFYDLLGKEVRAIKRISNHKFEVRRDNLKDGIYIYKLVIRKQGDETMHTGKITVISDR